MKRRDTVNAKKHGVDHEEAHKNYISAKYLDASSANGFIKAVIPVQYWLSWLFDVEEFNITSYLRYLTSNTCFVTLKCFSRRQNTNYKIFLF